MPQQYSQKYTVVCFFEPQEKSSDFPASDWPLHVTILDTFKTAWQLVTLSKALGEIATTVSPFDTIATQEAMLGEGKDVPVKLLQLEGGMSALHSRLMSLVDEGSFVFNTPEFVGTGFLPHTSDQENNQIEVGKTYRLGSISLIDMFPNNDHLQREVVDTYSFKG